MRVRPGSGRQAVCIVPLEVGRRLAAGCACCCWAAAAVSAGAYHDRLHGDVVHWDADCLPGAQGRCSRCTAVVALSQHDGYAAHTHAAQADVRQGGEAARRKSDDTQTHPHLHC